MTHPSEPRLVELPTEECWELLAAASVGRIAWTTTEGPVVVPVNFAVDGHSIHVRTAGFSSLVQKADAERVAFQVDRIDEELHTGWSVLARGPAEVLYGAAAQAGPQVTPWPHGPRSALVVIDVELISGRRLEP
jgi:uncharacterized protein